MSYTDTQLKQALAKMLPEKLGTYCCIEDCNQAGEEVPWRHKHSSGELGDNIKDTELLHLCWLVEETLDYVTKVAYMKACYQQPEFGQVSEADGTPDWIEVYQYTHATWRQRTIALCKVKGVEIV